MMQSFSNQVLKLGASIFIPLGLLAGLLLSMGVYGQATASTERSGKADPDTYFDTYDGASRIMQSGISTQTLWSLIQKSWGRTHPAPPPPPPVDPNPCRDGRSLKIGDWAVSDRNLGLSSAMSDSNTNRILFVGRCDAQQSDLSAGLGPTVIGPHGIEERLEPFADQLWTFEPEIDSEAGDYQLQFNTMGLSDIVVPVTLYSQDRIYTTLHDSQKMVRRFKSMTDVALSGDGFWGVDRLLATLVKVDTETPVPLHAWEIPVADVGSFVSAMPDVPDSVYGQKNSTGQFAIILCAPEDCDMAPSFVLDSQGQVSVIWPTLYSTIFCVRSADCSVETTMDVLVNGQSYWTAPLGPGPWPEQGSSSLDLTDDLSIEILANDPLVGLKNGSGIQHVDFSIMDEQGEQVYHWRDDAAPFCLFGDTDICTPSWNWDPLPPGIYDVKAWVVTPDGNTTEATDSPLRLLVK